MGNTLDERVTVDYTAGEAEIPSDYPTLDDKIEQAISVIKEALEQYHNPAVLWTGGKDSTLVLYLLLRVAEKYGYSYPPAIFIDHFQHFDDVEEFTIRWANRWGVELVIARNDDVASIDREPGAAIEVSRLNDRNQREVREKLEYDDDTFPFLLNAYVGNHLLKTVALNDTIEEQGFDGIISGVRWDEQEARSDETFFSPRHSEDVYPPHDRVHPILPFEERDVWDATWNYLVPDMVEEFPNNGYTPQAYTDLPDGVSHDDIPVSPKYFQGYRSLGSEASTEKTEDDPAWLQELDSTIERAGRAQDKEDLMERLRELGYM